MTTIQAATIGRLLTKTAKADDFADILDAIDRLKDSDSYKFLRKDPVSYHLVMRLIQLQAK